VAWIILFIAGLFEIGWAVGLKFTEGFTKPIPIALTAISLVLSMGLLGWAVKTLPLGTAYAVWTGVGAVGTAIVGIVLFKEPATAARLVCLGLIVAGILGLKVFSSGSAA
jgi:quaternary ammonium compound-resistance protein SugE